MTDQAIKSKYTEICHSLSSRKLKPAFSLLEKLISENGLGVYYDKFLNLEDTYRMMLSYTVEGINDPERQKIYYKLIVSVYELLDQVHEAIRLKYSPSVEYGKKRSFKTSVIESLEAYLSETENSYTPDNSASQTNVSQSPEAMKEQHRKIQRLFYHIWFTDKLTSEETKRLHTFLMNTDIPVYYRSYVVTAVMLSLQRFFDQEKFILLLEDFNSGDAQVSQRAMVGLLINLYKYDDRMPFYPAITNRLKILNENPEFKRNLESIILQFIRTKETEKLQQRIMNEFIPEVIKISPNLKNKINLDSLMADGGTEDRNPDWEEIFKDSPGFLNKIEEFSELQMKGSDVFMGSFAMLKSFPFFNELDNWFLPFFTDNPAFESTFEASDQSSKQLMEAIELAPLLCNSDKYSFCFSIQKLPKESIEFMKQSMNAEMEQIKEIRDDEELLNPGRKAGFVSNQHIQDLYRFYKLYPQKRDFEDIFTWRFDFHNKVALGDILKEDPKILKNIAEYYFAKNHFEEAVEIFAYLLEQEKTGDLYQKLGWCHQKMGDYEKALDAYLKAELYVGNQLWNLKKTALCYRNLKQPDKALEYYLMAEKLDPDNLGNQLNIGHCLLEQDKFDQALKSYFKVEYLEPGNKKVWRPIAWCSFLTGKKEQAEKYFLKLMSDEPNKHDFMNMGHVQWSMGNRKAALEFYRKSISKTGFTEEEFSEVFEEDLPHLIFQGINSDDVPIMLDQLRYLMEN